MSDFYLLDKNNKPYKVNVTVWEEWFRKNKRRVKFTNLKKYKVEISTVFLGVDHGYPQWTGHAENYRPILFETMVFLDEHNFPTGKKYSTWEEALEGHRETVRTVIALLRQKPAENFDLNMLDSAKGST